MRLKELSAQLRDRTGRGYKKMCCIKGFLEQSGLYNFSSTWRTLRLWDTRFSGQMNLISKDNFCRKPGSAHHMQNTIVKHGGGNAAISFMKAWSKALRTSDWAESSHFNRIMTLNTQSRQCKNGFRDTSVNVLQWSSQNLGLNPIKHISRNLKMAVHWQSPFNLSLKGFAEKSGRISPNPQLEAAKGAIGYSSTEYWVKGLNSWAFHLFYL